MNVYAVASTRGAAFFHTSGCCDSNATWLRSNLTHGEMPGLSDRREWLWPWLSIIVSGGYLM